jgi:hypothetical protein
VKSCPRVGVDFDNTLVCYDEVFRRRACALGLLPAAQAAGKADVRARLRETGREDAWTELQGYVYGPDMKDARPFPGALECLGRLAGRGVELFIVSHKTRYAVRGPRHDLHEESLAWLGRHGVLGPGPVGLSPRQVFFEPTREAKLTRIAALGCTHFVDDLPEVLGAPTFPADVVRLLFDPEGASGEGGNFRRVESWDDLEKELFAA